jgi:hypothetical protein
MHVQLLFQLNEELAGKEYDFLTLCWIVELTYFNM